MSTRAIVECDRQQAIIEGWANSLAAMMSTDDRLLYEMKRLSIFMTQLIVAMIDVRVENFSNRIDYAEYPSYQNTKQKVDQSIVSLGIELDKNSDYGSLVIFYTSVRAAITLAIDSTNHS